MRKLFSLIAAVLFAGSMMADEFSWDWTAASYASASASEVVWSSDNVTLQLEKASSSTNANNYLGGTNAHTRVYKDQKLSFVPAEGVTVSAVEITATSADYAKNFKNAAWTNATAEADGTVATITPTDGASEFYCVFGAATRATLVKVTYTKGEAPAVAKPVITGEAVFFDSTIVTMSCTTPDVDIYYTTDGTTDPKCDCAAAPEYKQPLVIKATTTIKAAAYTGNDWSAVAEKVFTKAPSFASFEDLIAAEVADKSLVEVSFENILIDSIYESSQGKRQGLYFTVNEKAYEIYYNKSEVPETWVAGGTVSGTIRGSWTLFTKANIWEIVPVADDWAWALNYVAPPTYTVAGSSIAAFGTSWAPTNEANDMELVDGIYVWEKDNLTLAAGAIEFKVCKNHAWTEAYPEQNYSLAIPEDGIYTIAITFNPDSKVVAAQAEKTGEAVILPHIILHGNFSGAWADTDPFIPAEDSLTASLVLALEEGTYDFGFKFDGAWKANGATLTREENATNLAVGSNDMHIVADLAGEYVITYTYATEDVLVTYPLQKDTVGIAMNKGLVFVDYTATQGWWDIYGSNEEYSFELSNIDAEQAEGVYGIEDLDPDYSYIVPAATGDTVHFTDGEIALAISEEGVVTIAGDLLGQDDVVYRFFLQYADPVAEDTVVVAVPEAMLYDKYAEDGLYGVYGTTEDQSIYVQLAIWAEDGFQGEFTEDDLDDQYLGSIIIVGEDYANIFKADIEVIPGNGEGVYQITADILCYNNVLYQVTMQIGEDDQAVDEIDAAKKVIKAIKNGQLIIEKNGAQYNVLGARL